MSQTCSKCQQPIETGNYYVVNGSPQHGVCDDEDFTQIWNRQIYQEVQSSFSGYGLSSELKDQLMTVIEAVLKAAGKIKE